MIPGISRFYSNPVGVWHADIKIGRFVVCHCKSTISEKDCRDKANIVVAALQLYAQTDKARAEGYDYYSDNCLSPAMGETI